MSSNLNESLPIFSSSKTLGCGNFGKVKLAKHKQTQQMVAIKIMYKQRIIQTQQLNILTRQIAILKSISHPNTIKLYEIIQTETELYLIMEYIEMNLMEYIEHKYDISEGEMAKIMYQILLGIEYLHSLGIAHRDLKPSNILITKNKVIKIIDFGLSNMYKVGNKLKSAVGSPSYAAPEIIENKAYFPLDVDIWSLGIIMYILLTGTLPFKHQNINELYHMILRVQYTVPKGITKLAEDLLKNILVIPASKRFKVKQIRTHPWIYYHTKNYQLPKEQNEEGKQEIVFQILEKQGHNKADVLTNLNKKKFNKLTTLYYLYLKKDLLKLKKINNYRNRSDSKNEQTTVLKTPRKITRRPGGVTPRVFLRHTPGTTPRVTSRNKSISTEISVDMQSNFYNTHCNVFNTSFKNKSFQTFIKLNSTSNSNSKPLIFNKVQTSKNFKYISSTDIKKRNSLDSITRYNFIRKLNQDQVQSYFGPYCLEAVYSQKIEVLKAHLLAFLKKERGVVEEIGMYKFGVTVKGKKFNVVINYLNGVKNVLILRVLGEAPEDVVQKLFYYTRKFQ